MKNTLLQKLYDTPGVHLHHRQAAVVHANDLPFLTPQSRFKRCYFPVWFVEFLYVRHTLSPTCWCQPLEFLLFLVPSVNRETSDKNRGLNGHSLFWGELVRIDAIKVI
jgi:nitric-oxide synthase, plant